MPGTQSAQGVLVSWSVVSATCSTSKQSSLFLDTGILICILHSVKLQTHPHMLRFWSGLHWIYCIVCKTTTIFTKVPRKELYIEHTKTYISIRKRKPLKIKLGGRIWAQKPVRESLNSRQTYEKKLTFKVFRQMQNNTVMRNHSAPILLAKTTSLTALNDLIIAFCMECRELLYPVGGYIHWEMHFKI